MFLKDIQSKKIKINYDRRVSWESILGLFESNLAI